MKRLLLLVVLLCLAGLGAAYYTAHSAENMTGSYVGLVKVPLTGWTAARINITRDGRDFTVRGRAGHYHLLTPQEAARLSGQDPRVFSQDRKIKPVYVWKENIGAEYKGRLVNNELVLDTAMGITFMIGRLRGTIEMADGTVFRKDTPENYRQLKEELKKQLQQQEPDCVILD